MFSYFSFRDFPIRCFPFRCFPPNPLMPTDFDFILFIVYIVVHIATDRGFHAENFRKYRDTSSYQDKDLDSPRQIEPLLFLQNEPVPLGSSFVDDRTALASTQRPKRGVYVAFLLTIIFVLLAWITHYKSPCSSLITSVLSVIIGVPELIIHSIVLCGSCYVSCERT